jgi:hypothetical protein
MSLELWKSIFDWATIIFIALTVFTGAGALITGDRLGKRQEEQLRNFQLSLTEAQTKLSEQQAKTLDLQKQVIAQGPRVRLLWPEATKHRIIDALTRFPKQKAEVSFCSIYLTDNDTVGLAMLLRGILMEAGWSLSPVVLGNCSGTGITVWRSANAPKATQEAAEGMVAALIQVPFEVLGNRVYVNELRRDPQPRTIQDGKEWTWTPPTDDTVFITVYAHP